MEFHVSYLQKLEGLEHSSFKQQKSPRPISSDGLDEVLEDKSTSHFIYQDEPTGDLQIKEERTTEFKQKERTGNSMIIKRYGVDDNSAEDSQTELHDAVSQGHLETVKILLERGANLNKPDAKGWTPKAIAEQQGNKGIYDLLISYENKRSVDEHKIEFLTEASDNTWNGQFKPTQNGITCSSSYVKDFSFIMPSNSNQYTDTGCEKLNKRRVTIHMKCLSGKVTEKQLGKLIILPDSIEDLFRIGGKLRLKMMELENIPGNSKRTLLVYLTSIQI